MVKGVNKTIIEVNETGSKLFEKIVFYVTPQYGNLSPKHLRRAVGEFTFCFDNTKPAKSLRSCVRAKRMRQTLLCGALVLAVFGTVVLWACLR